jgi:hypothetical protein
MDQKDTDRVFMHTSLTECINQLKLVMETEKVSYKKVAYVKAISALSV